MRDWFTSFLLASLLILSLPAQPLVQQAPGGTLAEDWNWAVSMLRGNDEPGWIGYSLDIQSAVQIWIGDFNLRIVRGNVEILGGRALESLLNQETAGDSAATSRVALLFHYDPNSDSIRRARFQDLRLPYQRENDPLYWLGHRSIESSLDHLLPLFQQVAGGESQRILITAIGLHQSPRVLPFLETLLASKQAEKLRERAASALGFQNTPQAVELARDTALEDSSHRVREEAVEALEDMSLARAEEILIELLSGSSHVDVRMESAEALENKPSEAAARALARAAGREDEDIRVRLEAIEALGEQGRRELVSRLDEIFQQSSDRRVRMEVIDALEEQESIEARELLHKWLMEAEDLAIQMEALEALAEISDATAAKDFLVTTLEQHPDPRIRAEALEELADRLAGEAVQDISRSALSDPHSHVRREAVEILGELGDDASIEALVEIVTEPGDPVLRRFAIEALAESGHPRAREILVRLARGNK